MRRLFLFLTLLAMLALGTAVHVTIHSVQAAIADDLFAVPEDG